MSGGQEQTAMLDDDAFLELVTQADQRRQAQEQGAGSGGGGSGGGGGDKVSPPQVLAALWTYGPMDLWTYGPMDLWVRRAVLTERVLLPAFQRSVHASLPDIVYVRLLSNSSAMPEHRCQDFGSLLGSVATAIVLSDVSRVLTSRMALPKASALRNVRY
eukprot:315887-Rhodomonas_salina.1